MLRSPPARAAAQRGLSLVELMVGIAVGLFVVAGAAFVVATQLGDNRRLLLETQLQQDLRATMDIITREIRRAGSNPLTSSSVWYPGTARVEKNNYAEITVGEASEEIRFNYWRSAGVAGPFGFRFRDGRLQSLIGGTWQELTDANVMQVTNFTITPVDLGTTQLPCPRECAGGGTACWPTLTVRDYIIDIAARSRTDAAVQRTLRNQVRVRNDWLRFNDAGAPDEVCPV